MKTSSFFLHFFAFLFIIMISSISLIRTKSTRLANILRGTSRYSFNTLSSSSLLNNTSIQFPTHPSYSIKHIYNIPEYNLNAALYQHQLTNSELLSFSTKDTNKVFGISFRTPSNNSTGIAHIMEHSVLCGSRKYPTKEPFVDLLKGSLQNYLNAFTYPDRTCYPVASINIKDFYNLVNVYLDAVFFPKAIENKQILQQEGWHYELIEKKNSTISSTTTTNNNNIKDYNNYDLIVSGVVFNEMKGVYSSSDSIIDRITQEQLFPNNIYHYDSGGNPDNISDLTFQSFQKFHNDYYHPSNSKVFFYGDDDLYERLVLLDSYLTDAYYSSNTNNTSIVDSSIKYQKKYDIKVNNDSSIGDPKIFRSYYAAEDIDEDDNESTELDETNKKKDKHMASMTWLLNDEELTADDLFKFYLLDYLLVGTSNSVVRKELLSEQNLGDSFLDNTGMMDDLLQATYSIGMRGIKNGSEGVKEYKTAVISLLEKISTEGFEEDSINSAMNSLEFKLREMINPSSGNPRGLNLMVLLLKKWNYDASSPSNSATTTSDEPLPSKKLFMMFHLIDSLKEFNTLSYEEKNNILKELVQKYFIQNPHHILVELIPKKNLSKLKKEEEMKKYEEIKTSKTDEEITSIYNEMESLKERQRQVDSPEDKSKLPKLHLSDLPKECKETTGNTKIFYFNKQNELISSFDSSLNQDLFSSNSRNDLMESTSAIHYSHFPTSDILYHELYFNLTGSISIDDVKYLHLLTNLFGEVSTKSSSLGILLNRLDAATGGVKFSVWVNSNTSIGKKSRDEDTELFLVVRSKCLISKVDELYSLLHEILQETLIEENTKRMREIIKEIRDDKESSMLESGHSFAASRLAMKNSLSGYLNEELRGISSLRNYEKFLVELDEDQDNFLLKLKTLKDKIYKKSKNQKVFLNLISTEENLDKTSQLHTKFLSSLPNGNENKNEVNFHTEWKELKFDEANKNEAFIIPSLVNYVGMGGDLFPNTTSESRSIHGSSLVASNFLSNGYLWENVRVLGGAYGGFMRLSEYTGMLNLLSYRDPKLVETIQTYRNIPNYLENTNELTEENLLQSIIGTIGDLDTPLSEEEEGSIQFLRFLCQEKSSDRNKFRQEILQTQSNDIQQTFLNRIKDLLNNKQKNLVVFGTASSIDELKQYKLSDKNINGDEFVPNLVIKQAISSSSNK